jgi:hypothetical protein
MQQERHLELVGLSRWRKSLNIASMTSKTAGRTDAAKLKMILLPEADHETDTSTTEAMDANAHVAGRAVEIATNAELDNALQTLGLEAMPIEGSSITTAVAKRKREGFDTMTIDQAGRIVRRKLFTAGPST